MYSVFAAGDTRNSHQAASPLVRLVEREERWEAPHLPQDVPSQNWDRTELNRTVSCMVLKSTANDMRTTSPGILNLFPVHITGISRVPHTHDRHFTQAAYA
ncbi:hypothetical protein TNCV_1520121 [Trichonephila clavipes]|nr:hypothetical protein TNCV_1520121 [Trichonephila clavipes]